MNCRNLRLSLTALFSLVAMSLLAAPKVMPGIEVLEEMGFEPLKGKRVGLVTNPSGVDHNLRSTIEILFNAPEVNLVALYGPEHGVRGDVYAGGHVEDAVDPLTGLPVYSLYGPTRKPTVQMLEDIDVMVYDIQDTGTRYYTFISTMGLVMEACAPLGIEVMVLDRPNPLGGYKIEGCVVEQPFNSFVSQYKIPVVYGLTPGELAKLINEEGLNCGQLGNQKPVKCKLTVIPMKGWERDMVYEQTGLPWVLPSPNIPYGYTAIYYACSGPCGEIYNYLQVGISYTMPFQVFAATWINPQDLLAKLNSYKLPGIAFRTIYYKPFAGSQAGKLLGGVQPYILDYDKVRLSELQFYVMEALAELYPEHLPFGPNERIGLFNKVCGTDYIKNTFQERYKVEDILPYWRKDEEAFRELSKKYYLYAPKAEYLALYETPVPTVVEEVPTVVEETPAVVEEVPTVEQVVEPEQVEVVAEPVEPVETIAPEPAVAEPVAPEPVIEKVAEPAVTETAVEVQTTEPTEPVAGEPTAEPAVEVQTTEPTEPVAEPREPAKEPTAELAVTEPTPAPVAEPEVPEPKPEVKTETATTEPIAEE